MHPLSPRSPVGLLLAAALILGSAAGLAQAPPAGERPTGGTVFQPLLADPKEPQFFAAYLVERSPRLAPRLGSVGFGQTIGLLGTPDWQVAIAAAVFSQFNMQSATTDLMNTDYLIGIPVSYRHGALATRFRIYHQSSHLGDGYMAHTHAQRVTFSYEAAELLASEDIASWRLYGGGEYMFTRAPDDLMPGILHGGVEFRERGALVRLGRLARGRVVAALDAKSLQDHDWQVGWSFVTGVEMSDLTAAPGSGWRWSVLLKAYTGPSPYGQFYRDHVSSLGLGLGFVL